MAKVKFTAPKIKDFDCPPDKQQVFMWDSDTAGLGVRATAGSKSYIFQSRLHGATVRVTIGDVSHWPLNSQTDKTGKGGQVLQIGAREEARRLQTIIDSGRDPRQVKAEVVATAKAQRDAEMRKATIVRDAWAAYLADRKEHWGNRHYLDHVEIAQAGGEKRKRSHLLTRPGPLAGIMGWKLSELTSEQFERWAAKEASTRPARARLALRLVKAFMKWCASMPAYRDEIKADAASSRRVREKLGTPTRRNAVLQREQLEAWFAEVRKVENPVIAAYLQFMLLCGPRPNEPLSIKWKDIEHGTIRIRDKIEGERVIPLTPYVESLIAVLPRRNSWVFSSPTSKSGQLVEGGASHDRACDRAGLPRITLQGLRRSFASLCEWIEVPAGVSAQIQGHAPQGVREQNYIRRPVDLLRSWHVKIEQWMLEQAKVEFKPSAPGLKVVA